LESLLRILELQVLIPWILSLFFGIFVGAIPGLTATMAVALIVPVSYYMTPLAGLAMIIGVSYTSIFAGDIPATFLRIPGTPASGAAILDGYELGKKGEGSTALSLNLFCSVLGGIIGVLVLVSVSSRLANFALRFTHFEYFWLGLFGISMSAVISKGSKLKGLYSVLAGLMVSTIGMDITTGYPRFSFGVMGLFRGINFIPAMIGLFGLSEVFKNITDPKKLENPGIKEKISVTFKNIFATIWRFKKTVLSSSFIGVLVGALPGAGADMAAWVSYGVAKGRSKEKEKFGRGSYEGVIAPTSANNAAIGGTWIPALVFGVPGDSITAIVLGAMMMYGLTPGPLVFERNPGLITNIFQIALITQFLVIFAGLAGIKAYAAMLKLKKSLVMAGVVIFSLVGAFALNNSVFDMGIVLVFGIIGYAFEKLDIPLPPMILALILGPMIENSLRVGLLQSRGSLMPFISRPISLCLMLLIAVTFFGGFARGTLSKIFARESKKFGGK